MELRTGEINKMLSGAEPWLSREQSQANLQAIPPVSKAQGGSAKRVGTEKTGEKLDSTGKKESKATDDPEQMKSMVHDIEDYLGELKINLNFEVEEKTGELVVQVLNSETGEVIRQLPTDEVLKLREKLKELRGVLFEEII